ncbi:hypothetical protein B0H66DRAFT_215820 [Apodospora peruviana]|uniref:Uncharacterized protein n=1 Tax=Apodospora peruviana TaxID=516989 RepID=A0AAE0IEK4_9PEZI|nr:hypothetical protein B0H66DRAFT_215820 [Apodospora peruviana]
MLKRCDSSRGNDAEFRNFVEAIISRVVPRFLGDQHLNNGKGVIIPAVVQGDLWCGSATRGRMADGSPEDVKYKDGAEMIMRKLLAKHGSLLGQGRCSQASWHGHSFSIYCV